MKKFYDTEKERNNKCRAVEIMFSDWHSATKDYIRVGVFNPSTSCLDLKEALRQGLIQEDTKLIFFENFEYIGEKNYSKQKEYSNNIFNILPMVKKENIYFHFGDLQTLQLGAALAQINAQKVNFMFIDLCSLMDKNIVHWMFTNRSLIESNSFQFYTISIQTEIRLSAREKTGFSEELRDWQKKDSFRNKMNVLKIGIKNTLTFKERNAIHKLDFLCSHLLNTTHNLDNIKNIVYLSKVSKMGVFHGRNNTVELPRWNLNFSLLFNEKPSYGKDVDEYGVDWGNRSINNAQSKLSAGLFSNSLTKKKTYRNRIYNKGQISLFRDTELPDNFKSPKPFRLFEYLKKNQGNKNITHNFQTISQVINVMYRSLYPPEYDSNRYKNSILALNFSRRIINKYMLNKPITVDGIKYVFVHQEGKYRYISLNGPK